MYLNDLLKKIEVKRGVRPKRVGKGYSCLCSSHDDKKPSLSVSAASDGKILLKCHAGCSTEEICKALDLQITDLFSPERNSSHSNDEKIEYIYHSSDGRSLYKKVRCREKQFFIMSYSQSGTWEKGLKDESRVLYHLPEVLKAIEEGSTVFVVEGEKDVERLRKEGLTATTPIEGAGSNIRSEYASQLKDANIALLYDEDRAGYKRRDQWLELLKDMAASVRVIKLPGIEYQEKSGKDISDWLREGHKIQELLEIVEKTNPINFGQINSSGGLFAIDIAKFLNRKIPEREMILDPIIPSQGLSMIYSKRGVGKTFLSLAIGYAVAAGVPILRWRCTKPVK